MAGTDDYLRLVLNLAAEEAAFLDPTGRPEDAELNAMGIASVTSPAVSLMITNRQRAALRELGFSEDSIRRMTPAEAHGKLGLA